MLELKRNKPNRFYESVVIVRSESSEDATKQVFKKSKSVIKDFSGELSHIETWGDRPLKNPIKKSFSAKYFYLNFEASAECIKELERNYKNNEDVMRFVHIRLDERIPLKTHLENFHEEVKRTLTVFEEDQSFYNQKKSFKDSKFKK